MIRYTERDTDLNPKPPFEMANVTAIVTAKRVTWRPLQDWVDKTLNWRPDGRSGEPRFVVAPVAFVVFLEVKEMRSRDPAYSRWPAMTEREMHVTVPLCEIHGGFIPDLLDPVFHPLLLCLDSSPAMIAGREVFGFPKIGGDVEIRDGHCEARTEVWTGVGELRTQRNELLVGLRRSGEAAGGSPQVSVEEALDQLTAPGLEEPDGWLGEFRELLEDCWSGEIFGRLMERVPHLLSRVKSRQEFVFLKQFRDHCDPRAASYRAVVKTEIEFSGLRRLQREAGRWQLEVPDHRSSRLLREIGLTSGPVEAPLTAEFDFVLPPGRTVWSSDR